MKFSTRQDASIPAEQLFSAISDFDRLQRIVLRNGGEVAPVTPDRPGVLAAWKLGVPWHGRLRRARLSMTRQVPPDQQIFEGECEGLDVTLLMNVLSLNARRSQLGVQLELRPRSFRARLAVQAAKLGKHALDEKFASRIARLVNSLEQQQAQG